MCWLYVEELPRTSTMIEQWLHYTNWRRAQMRGLPIRLPIMLMLFCVVTACFEMNPLRVPYCRCEHFGFSIQVAFLEVQKCDLGLFLFLNHKKHLISFHVSFWASSKLIFTVTKWGGVACETTSVHGPQCNFRPRNTTSVHSRQIPSTSTPPRYLIHCCQPEWAKHELNTSNVRECWRELRQSCWKRIKAAI